jgi:hypothetical protein
MSVLFYTINYKHQYFYFAEHTPKYRKKGVQVEYLDENFQIADADDVESFKAYFIEVYGTFMDDATRVLNPELQPLGDEELRRMLMIYIPSDNTPALFAIDEEVHDGLARLNISHYEKSIPQLELIFENEIDSDELPNPDSHRMPPEWLER